MLSEKYEIKSGNGFGHYLNDACDKENFHIIKFLIKCGMDVNETDGHRVSPLMISCRRGNESILKYLIEHGANINVQNYRGQSPLIIACENKNNNIINI